MIDVTYRWECLSFTHIGTAYWKYSLLKCQRGLGAHHLGYSQGLNLNYMYMGKWLLFELGRQELQQKVGIGDR